MQRPIALILLWAFVGYGPLTAQVPAYDRLWYSAGQPHVKLKVAEDGIYRVEGAELASIGVDISGIDPTTLRLIENGTEIPIWYEGSGTSIESGHHFLFVGRRNSGRDEAWVYQYNSSLQSSPHLSLYTNETTYFLTWGGAPGIRYTRHSNDSVSGPVVSRVRVDGRLESDDFYFFGSPGTSGNPLYSAGEGYYMSLISHGSTVLRASNIITFRDLTRFDSDSLTVEAKVQGGTGSPHLNFLDLVILDPVSQELSELPFDSLSWFNYDSITLRATLSQKLVPGQGQNLRVRVRSDNSAGFTPNNMYVDYVAYTYVRSINPASGPFHFRIESTGPTRYQLAAAAGGPFIVLNPESASRFDVTGGAAWGESVESGQVYWVGSPTDVLRPTLAMDEPSDLGNTDRAVDYVVISAAGLMQSAEEFADYRRSVAGGAYSVEVFNVVDVYDQFDYGRPTPIAIRRFIDHMRQWSGRPQYVLLWGDALYPDARREILDWEVPSFGNASSDGWFAMQSGGNLSDYTESVAMGRITLRTNERGSAFVDKIRRYEATPPADWQKRAILMSGGATTSEQIALTAHTRRWGEGMASEPFGADITFFHKTSTAALDPTFLDSVDAAITEGSGWLAFFGHSAADTWEIVTADPTLFSNSTTLPIAVSLGCFTGAFARGDGSQFDQPPFAELLVTESENGAIAHYGGSTSSFISVASQIADPFYDIVFSDGERILGEAVRISKIRYLGSQPSNSKIETVLQYNLMGDPATRMALPAGPDFHIAPRSVSVEPAAPVAGIDSSMTVTVVVENRGLVPADTVDLELIRTSPGGAPISLSARLAPFALTSESDFELPITNDEVGETRLHVTVDPGNAIAEVTETDNSVEISQFVFASGVVQLYPPDFGLLVTNPPTLRFGKAAPAQERLAVTLQLDTTEAFDSNVLVTDLLEVPALTSWIPPTALIDGQTYYWRVAVDSDDPPQWRTRAFTIRQDLPQAGWLQQGGRMAGNDHGPFLTLEDGGWKLENYNVDVRIRSAQFGATAASTIIVGGFEHQTLAVGFAAAIASSDGIVYSSDSFVAYPNLFNRDEAVERQRLRDFMASANENDYIFVNTRFIRVAAGVTDLPEDTKQIFREFGSTQIDSVQMTDLWNFAVRIGDAAPIVDDWQPRDPQVGPHIHFTDFSIPVRFVAGASTSPLVGPATRWHEFRMSGRVGSDRSSIDAFILGLDGDTLATERLLAPGGDAVVDLGPTGLNVDARRHPFLSLQVVISDSTRLNTPQLDEWYVGYDPISELVIDAPGFSSPIDTVSEGEAVNVAVSVINGGPNPVDSVFVRYTVTDRNNRSSVADVDTLLNLAVDSSTPSTGIVVTNGLVGSNRITVGARQSRGPEPATFNNTAIGSFRVRGDDVPPVFTLTVDGSSYPNDPRVITSTDDPTLPFFPARPTFNITVSDDNPFLSLGDTTVINLTLDGARIGYTRPDVEFVPGSPPDNEARLIFSPDFTGQDTTHTLKAWAQDASGNSEPTKEAPYTLSFRVQGNANVESLYPYPNPMHNFTTFMFRLLGADASLVEDFRIRVYTISGRPVREFDLVDEPGLLEGGGLRIGWNRLVWDGRDEDGDLLATGVYLYKVFLKADGREISVNNDSGIEKLAIIR